MALPPKGDPRRPLHLAIRSTRLLGIILLLFGSCSSLAFVAPRGRFGSFGPRMFLLLAMLGVYVLPGVAYLVFSIFLKERKLWAVIAAIITASLNLLLVLLGGIGMAITMFRTNTSGADTAQMIAAIVIALWVLALAQLIYHLALSFKAIQYIPLEEQRGFAPVMIPPVPPPNPPDALPPA